MFLANFRGVESVTVTRKKLGLMLLRDRRISDRMVLLLKILSNNIHQSLMDQFDIIISYTHSHNTRSVAHNDPRAFAVSNAFSHNSFLPRTFHLLFTMNNLIIIINYNNLLLVSFIYLAI